MISITDKRIWRIVVIYQALRGLIAFRQLYEYFKKDWCALAAASPSELRQAGLTADQLAEIDKTEILLAQLKPKLERAKIACIIKGLTEYPYYLEQINDPPLLLFVKGTIPDRGAVSIIGSRDPSPYGKRVTEEIAAEAAKIGLVVVSGLARGIDGIAHQAAIAAGGPTIAVLPCSIEKVYPSKHRRLAQQIIESGGALLSEFPFGTQAFPYNFPQRNRIIAGLSRLTIITECLRESGTMLTVNLALGYQRDIWAVPGDLGKPLSAGPNHLLYHDLTNGPSATPYLEPRQLADYYNLEPSQPFDLSSLAADERHILSCLTKEGVLLDKLAELSNLDIVDLSSKVVMLELKGLVRHEGAGLYRKTI